MDRGQTTVLYDCSVLFNSDDKTYQQASMVETQKEAYEKWTTGHKKKILFEELVHVVKNNLTVPINIVIEIFMWRSNTTLRTLNDRLLANVIKHIKIQTSHLSVLQLYEYICKAHCVYFESYVSNFNDYYYDENISGKIVKDLLRYQFQDDEEVIRHFIITLFHILNRRNGKKNCLNLIGEPTSFKFTFVQMVASAMLNTGWCNKNNKYVSFGLQECARK
ncbi:uncharacterized protein LOC126470378 [Schistocerca serialis cubense]|uniref:uncharacterized protein LOC126470378 n=1 Tax=Schistocerca serialis cubense TaxID=2023355 RepID=UPI00214E2EDE|nr:uncharacterized protein LOC126470378 [Schistocerca serialis cubense]